MPRLFNFVRSAFVLILFAGLAQPLFASTDFTIPPGRAAWPYAMVVGPDKNLWFVELGGLKVGRITTAGVITEFPIANAQGLIGIASGPDGNLWFTDMLAGTVGHISTSGTNLVQYSLKAGTFPTGITAGPDGNLWFVEQKQKGDYEIGTITTAGKIKSYSTKETAGVFQAFSASGVITTGPDGNLWFVNSQNGLHDQVGKITTKGAVTFYSTADLPNGLTTGPDGNLWLIETSHVAKFTTGGVESECATLTEGSGFPGIVTGPDGNIWFTETDNVGNVVPSTCALTEYAALGLPFEFSQAIVSAPDGNLWITSFYGSDIGRITTAGALTGTFALSTGAGGWNAAGPDGNLWFTETYPANAVGKMTTEGVVTTYPIPTANAGASGITAGPDGNLWFLETDVEQIAKVTPSGAITEFAGNGYSWFGIIAGPDGNLWFPYIYANSCGCSAIGRITTSGVTTAFPTTTASSDPFDVAVGPDGNIWFAENANPGQIGTMSTAGAMLAEYPTKTVNSSPSAITSGSDGNLWFLENTAYGAVGKMTTSGKVTEYKAQIQSFENGIISGPDGAIWFGQCYPNSLARVSTEGVVSMVPFTTPNACVDALTVGPDHKIWADEGVAGALGRLSAIGGTGQSFTATHGVEFTGEVASFVDGTPTATASNFTATINWGDKTTSTGTVTGSTGGPFAVSGSHTYSKAGTFEPYVTFYDTVDNSTYTSSKGKAKVN